MFVDPEVEPTALFLASRYLTLGADSPGSAYEHKAVRL